MLSGVFALLGALVGAGITQHSQRRLAEDQRRADHLHSHRELVTRVLSWGYQWAEDQDLFVPINWKMTMQDRMEFVDTDSGRRMKHVGAQYREALLNARMHVRDEPLRDDIALLSSAFESFAEQVSGPIVDRSEDFDTVLAGLRYIRGVRETLRHLEATAADLYRVDATGIPRSGPWWKFRQHMRRE